MPRTITVELLWLIHLDWLELSSWSLQVILGIILPGTRTNFHGPKPVLALKFYFTMQAHALTITTAERNTLM